MPDRHSPPFEPGKVDNLDQKFEAFQCLIGIPLRSNLS